MFRRVRFYPNEALRPYGSQWGDAILAVWRGLTKHACLVLWLNVHVAANVQDVERDLTLAAQLVPVACLRSGRSQVAQILNRLDAQCVITLCAPSHA